MENRRQDYRHTFEPHERLQVEVLPTAAHQPIRGEILNLSVGGMAVRLLQPVPVTPYQRLRVTIPLATEQTLTLSAEAVHTHTTPEPQLGCRFLPLADPHATERRDQSLWCYLLDAQRRSRRRARQSA